MVLVKRQAPASETTTGGTELCNFAKRWPHTQAWGCDVAYPSCDKPDSEDTTDASTSFTLQLCSHLQHAYLAPKPLAEVLQS